MPLPKSWQAQHSVHLSVCLRGRGSEVVAGAAFYASERVFAWQGQHLAGVTHTHSLTHTHSHTLTHSHSLTLTYSLTGAACGSCLKGWGVVARATRGSRNRGRRSTLEMPLPKSWQAQHSVHLSVCLRGRGSEVVAGAAFCASAHTLIHTHSLTHTHSHSLTHSQGLHLKAIYIAGVLSRARLGACEIVAGAALWRCRCRSRGRRSILCI